MLNENDLSKILNDRIPHLKISDIHWKTQDSNSESILFYKILPDEKSQKLFVDRIGSAKFGWVIVNVDHPSRPINSTIISEEKWPEIQKEILDNLYPLPPLKLFALTGTNGKTTTADLFLQIGELCGKKGMSIGTLGVRSNHKTILDFGLTSPSLIDLRKYLNIYGKDKDFCVLEASSHALMQSRLFGLEFEMGGWLSFSQDHLDYHKTMEEYFAAKALITNYVKDSGKIFVPSSQSDLFNKISRVTSKVQKARVIEQTLPLFFSTNFNRNNLEVAVDMVECGFNIVVPDIFHKIIPPDGRFYIKPFRTNFIVVDFAHTPDALDNICQGIRAAFPKHRLKVLFGCGGDRDRTKRPLMGKIAETWGNEIYVTSDNPRSEDPEQIIDEIVQGMSTKMIYKITERPKAVQTAFSELKENEILLLAGKGHEDYILIKGVKHPYSDIGEVEKFLARKNV
jgi:UDP-N-acetylmuramoyl-L-alanyl-D-glutamate--2,6-diaminopimelate ligase